MITTMASIDISFLLQSAFCRVRVLAAQPMNDERRQLIWEIADAAHNLPVVLAGAQIFPDSVVMEEVEKLERLLCARE